MKRKLLSFIAVLLIGGLIWYFFIKPYDYLVSFTAKANPGTINQTIKLWNSSLNLKGSIDQENLQNLMQTIHFKDSVHTYIWNITPLTDSTSSVKIYIKDVQNSLKNKASLHFGTTDFERRTEKMVLDFNKKLNEHLKNFRVTIQGEEAFQATYCAYIPLKGNQFGKAKSMMQNYVYLSNTLVANNITLNGRPIIEVVHWNQQNDSISYNFCYPIIKTDSLPEISDISYKEIKGTKALKAIYNGNYITSDRAWYSLQDYAKKNKINITANPIEVFHNNPSSGMNELTWKTEIFMPIANE